MREVPCRLHVRLALVATTLMGFAFPKDERAGLPGRATQVHAAQGRRHALQLSWSAPLRSHRDDRARGRRVADGGSKRCRPRARGSVRYEHRLRSMHRRRRWGDVGRRPAWRRDGSVSSAEWVGDARRQARGTLASRSCAPLRGRVTAVDGAVVPGGEVSGLRHRGQPRDLVLRDGDSVDRHQWPGAARGA